MRSPNLGAPPTGARHTRAIGPEETVLYKLLAEHRRSFLAEADATDEGGAGLPRYVVDEIEAFLKCGILADGFLRVAWDDCQESRCVPVVHENGSMKMRLDPAVATVYVTVASAPAVGLEPSVVEKSRRIVQGHRQLCVRRQPVSENMSWPPPRFSE